MAKANPVVRWWKYMSAWSGAKLDEKADPKIQIQQAIQEAQQQHEQLVRQAANVIANQRQLEMKLDRQLSQIETLQSQARQALVLADKARADGDAAKGADFDQTAQALANQLVGAEQSVQDMKTLHDQSLSAAQQAREAVENNKLLLQEKLTERTKLLSQLEQAKMQEAVSASLQQVGELGAARNTPSLDEVRDKIEKRYAVALGQADLASNNVDARMIEVRRASINLEGSSRLQEIRASLDAEKKPAIGGGQTSTGPQAVTSGATPQVEGAPTESATAIPADAAVPEAEH